MKGSASRLHLIFMLLFAIELAAGLFMAFAYKGAMSIGVLVSLPLLGLLLGITSRTRRGDTTRGKLFGPYLVLLLLLPPILFAVFRPNVSYDKAVELVRMHVPTGTEIVNEGERSFVMLEGVSNPFISKGYKIVASKDGSLSE